MPVDDLQIAKSASLIPPAEVAAAMGLDPALLEPYGTDVAKIRLDAIPALADRPKAKYVIVSAITPTPLGEGKTTTTVGLGQALNRTGRKATIAIRQPSMGPTFGIKGGAAGGGYSQVVPMEKFNLHLTGDFHAVTSAHNMLSAVLDNHLYQDNDAQLDPHSITWRRVLDINERALRHIVTGLGSRLDGIPRESGFDISSASEVMAILALATSLPDLRERLGRIVVGYTREGKPVTAEDIQGAGAMAALLKDALAPNLLQTLENTPALVHAGPFGNIAHGNSSIVADLIGIRSGEYLVTEAGFGADMGAERFFNIKCRTSGLAPDAAVIVATVRALKAHSDKYKIVAGKPLPEEMLQENPDDVAAGAANLRKQIENMRKHGVSPVVAINAFPTDFDSEHRAIAEIAEEMGARSAVCTHFADGGAGATDLAEAVAEAASGAVGVPAALPRRDAAAGQDRDGGPGDLRRGRRRLHHGRRPPAGLLRGQRVRQAPGLHRQDAPVDLVRPDAEGRPDGLAAAGARGAGVGGRGLRVPDLRGHADHAGARCEPGRAPDRPGRRRRGRRAVLTWRPPGRADRPGRAPTSLSRPPGPRARRRGRRGRPRRGPVRCAGPGPPPLRRPGSPARTPRPPPRTRRR